MFVIQMLNSNGDWELCDWLFDSEAAAASWSNRSYLQGRLEEKKDKKHIWGWEEEEKMSSDHFK